VTVLCLTELDGVAPADASLRALTLGRSLGDPSLAAVVFADSASVPAAALAGYGVTGVHVIEPSALEGYAPQAWARALAGLAPVSAASPATRYSRTSARSPACRWPRTARSSPLTAGRRTGSSGTAGPGYCSRRRS